MGKYLNEYKRMQQQKDSFKHTYNRINDMYGSIMSPEAKAMNQASQNIREKFYDKQINDLYSKALKEMQEEAVAEVMKRISVEVNNEASKTLQDLEKQLSNMFK